MAFTIALYICHLIMPEFPGYSIEAIKSEKIEGLWYLKALIAEMHNINSNKTDMLKEICWFAA